MSEETSETSQHLSDREQDAAQNRLQTIFSQLEPFIQYPNLDKNPDADIWVPHISTLRHKWIAVLVGTRMPGEDEQWDYDVRNLFSRLPRLSQKDLDDMKAEAITLAKKLGYSSLKEALTSIKQSENHLQWIRREFNNLHSKLHKKGDQFESQVAAIERILSNIDDASVSTTIKKSFLDLLANLQSSRAQFLESSTK